MSVVSQTSSFTSSYSVEVNDDVCETTLNYFHRVRGSDPVLLEVKRENNGQSFVRFEITREGPSMPSEIRERIFDWQMRSSQPSAGVGLPLAKALVLKYGGTISAENQASADLRRGIKFVIRLPSRSS